VETINYSNHVFGGKELEALKTLKELIDDGLDPKNFLNDILELIYLFSRRINLGPIDKELFVSESELSLIEQACNGLKMEDLGLFWQLTLKTIEDLNTASNENITLEMYIIQLIHLKSIDEMQKEPDFHDNGKNKNFLKDETDLQNNKPFTSRSPIKNQLKSVDQVKTITKNEPVKKIDDIKNFKINSFSELIKLAEQNKEIELKYDLERNVKVAKFENGKIDINFNENLNKNFIKKLSQCLHKWTEKRWIITLSKEDNLKTFHQEKIDKKRESLDKEKNSETFKEMLDVFPDADLTDIGKKDE
jgi:DNA polymerase III, gamma/tau subunits